MGPQIIAIALALALLALVPTRRLALSGARREVLAIYFLGLWLLGLVVVGGALRILFPILLVVYLVPFVTLGEGVDALRRRVGARPVKDVTPPDEAERRT